MTSESLAKELREVKDELRSLIDSFEYGRFCRDGVKVVLAGRPNAGKSSLLNSLLDRDRAIVTEIPGTTRDVIEESVVIKGMLFRLTDTAGLREAVDVVEKEGVRRTRDQLKEADICVYVVDIAAGELEEDARFVAEARQVRNGKLAKEIVVANKIDLLSKKQLSAVYLPQPLQGLQAYLVSAQTREGIDNLMDGLMSASAEGRQGISDTGITITNERHKNELEKARTSIELALDSVQRGESGDVVAIDIRGAIDGLGAIVGTVTSEEILNNVFARFCIGK